MKTYHGIIEPRHLIDPRRMGLLREQYAEQQKGRLRCYCNQAWMKKWWADSMECYCHLRNVQDLRADGKTHHERRFGAQWSKIVRFLQKKTCQGFTNLARKFCQEYFFGYALIARRIWKGDILVANIIGKHGRIGNPLLKNQCKRSVDVDKGEKISYSRSRWYGKIVRKRPRIPRPYPKAGTTCKE